MRGQNLPPLDFRAAEHGGDQLRHLVAGGGAAALGDGRRRPHAAQRIGALDQHPRIEPERPADQAEHENEADADTAAAAARHADTSPPPILDVVAAR